MTTSATSFEFVCFPQYFDSFIYSTFSFDKPTVRLVSHLGQQADGAYVLTPDIQVSSDGSLIPPEAQAWSVVRGSLSDAPMPCIQDPDNPEAVTEAFHLLQEALPQESFMGAVFASGMMFLTYANTAEKADVKYHQQ